WLINAAGAWADNIARLAGVRPLGITPKRRTVVTFTPPAGGAIDHWPLVRDADESFYFKPFGGDILLTPADETPLAPCDAQPEEIDIAIALARMQAATGITPSHLASRWAGLRSFTRDERPA
ncbi:MAG TPA: FAD-binding oxidoreductase, partial [Alphaproteobacteria bacterium]|nr:FAD-binding oxidoreductase [Alphaproteobacteria bacterium]